MERPDLENADAENWRAQMLSFYCRCAESAPAAEADRIREARDLFEMAPESSPIETSALVEKGRLESLLRSGAPESAALALLRDDAGFMISRGSNGSNLATVVPPGRTLEYTATGRTFALALVAAQTALLLAEAGHFADRSVEALFATGLKSTHPTRM